PGERSVLLAMEGLGEMSRRLGQVGHLGRRDVACVEGLAQLVHKLGKVALRFRRERGRFPQQARYLLEARPHLGDSGRAGLGGVRHGGPPLGSGCAFTYGKGAPASSQASLSRASCLDEPAAPRAEDSLYFAPLAWYLSPIAGRDSCSPASSHLLPGPLQAPPTRRTS